MRERASPATDIVPLPVRGATTTTCGPHGTDLGWSRTGGSPETLVGDDDMTEGTELTITISLDTGSSKPVFMGTSYLHSGIKKIDERPGRRWLARLTYNEGEEPSQDVKDLSSDLDRKVLVPLIRQHSFIPLEISKTSDHSRGQTWTDMLKRYHDRAYDNGERMFYEAWDEFQKAHPEASDQFDVKYVPQEVYAAAYPDPSSVHTDSFYNWANKGVFDFEEHTKEVDEFHADSSEASKPIVLTTVALKKGAYLGYSADVKEEAGRKDEDLFRDLPSSFGSLSCASAEDGADLDSTCHTVLPKCETMVRMATLPGHSISQEKQDRISSFVNRLTEQLNSVPQSTSPNKEDDKRKSYLDLWYVTQNYIDDKRDKLKEQTEMYMKQEGLDGSDCTYINTLPEQIEEITGMQLPQLTDRQYWDWLKRSKGYGADGPES
ncbi:hypothetical protein I302_100928 [Kwoniella bestiolae CBS 10118]|uniref:Uncharacterized protein n=1 Tax=Kwoniella bestiolae CBS 10118 TaxID=1296100 RepID=A0A1B9G6J4_9TREE|nr:hypothetical protein I302_04304 [Kwoniella bestiolae CBS 10118]OCF26618.1 hypothetical protein I302_04304 [Kwoniella bestiolae CBS 10118]